MPAHNTRPSASVAQYTAGTPGTLITSDTAWASGAQVAITFSTTVTIDLATLINGSFTATANFTLANPVNLKPGQTGRIRIAQDTNGSRTISYGSFFKKAAADASTLSTPASAVDFLYYDVVDASTVLYTIRRAVA